MKIVHIMTRLLRAGSEENTLQTSAGQVAQGHEVILLHGRDVIPENAAKLAPGAKLVAASHLIRDLSPGNDLAAFHEIRQILRETRPDVVHVHQSKAGVIGRLAAASARVPLIVHGVHILPFLGVSPIKQMAYLWSERQAAKVTHGFIHVSEGMRNACISHGVGANKPHYVVPSGFDLDRFASATPPPDLVARLGLHQGTPHPFTIVMLAALEPRKRHIELIRQSAGFLRQFPQARLILAGEGYLKNEIEAMIAALQLEEQVILLGFRDDPERIIAMADVCVHVAEREGLPRVVLQYLAAKRPIVMFDLPGIEEVLVDGVNGHVVPQGDWLRFFDRLAPLVTAPERRAAITPTAENTKLEKWDARFMADRTLDIYRALQTGPALTRVAS